jgi:hypothetical protein
MDRTTTKEPQEAHFTAKKRAVIAPIASEARANPSMRTQALYQPMAKIIHPGFMSL